MLSERRWHQQEAWGKRTYIEVDDLSEQSDDNKDQHNVEEPLLELTAVGS